MEIEKNRRHNADNASIAPEVGEHGLSALALHLARAHAWMEMIETGKVASIPELIKLLNIDKSYITRDLRLLSLAPDLQKLVIEGREPETLSLARLREPLTGEQLGLACQDAKNYAEVEKEYFRQLEYLLNQMMEWGRKNEKTWKFRNPSPLLSGSMTDCMLNGRDVSEGGTKYNTSGVMCAAIADATDSLAIIKFLYEKGAIQTIAEFKDILACNWNGYDQLLHLVLHHFPRWGNNDDDVDAIARRIADFSAHLINNTPNARGGGFQMGLWSIHLNHDMGRKTGALPDGRKSDEPLAKNICSRIGMDRNGVTALINSVSKLDHAEFPDGSVLDVMLHPSLTSGPDGEQIICDLIRTCRRNTFASKIRWLISSMLKSTIPSDNPPAIIHLPSGKQPRKHIVIIVITITTDPPVVTIPSSQRRLFSSFSTCL